MMSMLMDELHERGVLILSLWFISIVSLLLLQYIKCNFLVQESEWKSGSVIRWWHIVFAKERGNGFVHCFYIVIFEALYLKAQRNHVEIDAKFRLFVTPHTCTDGLNHAINN